MTPQLPSFDLCGRILKDVRAFGPLLHIAFDGEFHLILMPETDPRTTGFGWRLTSCQGLLPANFSATEPILPANAQGILGKVVLSEELRPRSQSLVMGFDENYELSISVQGEGICVSQNGVPIREVVN